MLPQCLQLALADPYPMMYRFTAEEVIGYIRVCRPGSVIGPQQNFIRDIEARMWHEGDVWRATRGIQKPHLALCELFFCSQLTL